MSISLQETNYFYTFFLPRVTYWKNVLFTYKAKV